MKKKHIVIALLAAGIALLCVSVILAGAATANMDIIGGADFPTFVYVFFNRDKGLYPALAFLGIVLIIASAVVGVGKKKK